MYGLFIGGSGLDKDYKSINGRAVYSFASQRRNVKTISFIERELVSARDSTTTLKFDGKLDPVSTSTTEIGKERFLTLLERRVEEHGQETFYYVTDIHGKVVNLFEHVHNFDLDTLVKEFNLRNEVENTTFAAFDSYEEDEIMLSRLVVESLLTSTFYEKIFIRYGHRKDFKRLPGSCLLVMALETCNASVSHDIDGAATAFANLSLDTYPGEDVSDLSNEALRLIKIMQGGYALPVNTGSRLLQKVTSTSCEEFNRKIFNLLDVVKTMEHKYKVIDPRLILADDQYPLYGPVGLITTLHQIHGRLIADHDWPALATKLPQSNNVTGPEGRPPRGASSAGGAEERRCFRCKGPHLIKDCPQKNSHSRGGSGSDSEQAPKKAKTELPAWKYIEPKDITKPLIDNDGRHWKFCTKCVCRKSGKVGMYLLSHFDSEHKDNYATPTQQSNHAAVDVPLGIPTATTIEPDPDSTIDDDPMEFQGSGAWCAPVDNADSRHAFFDTADDATPVDDMDTYPVDVVSPAYPDVSTAPQAWCIMFQPDVDDDVSADGSELVDTNDNDPVIVCDAEWWADWDAWMEAAAAERERLIHHVSWTPAPSLSDSVWDSWTSVSRRLSLISTSPGLLTTFTLDDSIWDHWTMTPVPTAWCAPLVFEDSPLDHISVERERVATTKTTERVATTLKTTVAPTCKTTEHIQHEREPLPRRSWFCYFSGLCSQWVSSIRTPMFIQREDPIREAGSVVST